MTALEFQFIIHQMPYQSVTILCFFFPLICSGTLFNVLFILGPTPSPQTTLGLHVALLTGSKHSKEHCTRTCFFCFLDHRNNNNNHNNNNTPVLNNIIIVIIFASDDSTVIFNGPDGQKKYLKHKHFCFIHLHFKFQMLKSFIPQTLLKQFNIF